MKSSTHSSSSAPTPSASHAAPLEQQRSPSPSSPPLPIFHEEPSEAASAPAIPVDVPYTGPDEGCKQYAAGLTNKYLTNSQEAAQLAKKYGSRGSKIVANSEKFDGVQGLARWAHWMRTKQQETVQQAANGASKG